jgi:hypothetical protein
MANQHDGGSRRKVFIKMRKATTRDLVEYLITPVLFLTVALTGGLRFQIQTDALQFIPPQLFSCIVGVLAMILLVRCGVVRMATPGGEGHGLIESASRLALITALYLATVQVFNTVTPERGVLNFVFNTFYLLILLHDLFVVFNPRRLAGALATILGTSFLLKYLLLADLFAPGDSWGKFVLQELMKAGSLGALDPQPFAAATGYLAFFTIGLYVLGLYLIAPQVSRSEAVLYKILTRRYQLGYFERARLLRALWAPEFGSEPVDAEIAGWVSTAKTPGQGGELRE